MRDIKIIENISDKEYHSIRAASSSTMKQLRANKLAFIDSILNPREKERSEQMILGEMVHCLVLQPELFDEKFVIVSRYSSKSEDEREQVKNDAVEKANKIASNILSIDMIRNLVNHPLAKKELAIFWTDIHTGLPCKCKFDLIIPELGIFIDIKTTSKGIDENSFAKTIADFGYDRQAAWYTKAANGAYKRNDFNCALIAADTTDGPHGVEAYILDEDTLNTGKELYKNDLQEYKNITTMIETGMITDIQSTLKNKNFKMISIPSWAKDLNRR